MNAPGESAAPVRLVWPKACPGCLGWSHADHRYDVSCELMPVELIPAAHTCLRCGNQSIVPHGDGYRCRDCGATETLERSSMSTIATTKVDEVKDAILAKIAEKIETAEGAEEYGNIGQLAAAYRQLADACATQPRQL